MLYRIPKGSQRVSILGEKIRLGHLKAGEAAVATGAPFQEAEMFLIPIRYGMVFKDGVICDGDGYPASLSTITGYRF